MKYSIDRLIIYQMQMVMSSDDEVKSKFCRLADVTCKTRKRGQQEKPRISCRCRDKETADRQNCSAKKSWQTMLNMSSISDLRPTAPKILNSLNTIMQGTVNENVPCLPRICNSSDQPKIERLVNNDARLNGTTT